MFIAGSQDTLTMLTAGSKLGTSPQDTHIHFFVTKGLTSYYYVTTRHCCLLVRLYYFQRLTSSHCTHMNKSCFVVVRTPMHVG